MRRRLALGGLGVPAATLALYAFAAQSAPATSSPEADVVLVRLSSAPLAARSIQDSKWGMIGSLQASINAWADRCGVDPVKIDGHYGPATAEAARAVAACRGAAPSGEAGELTVEAWQAVVGSAPPDALERARAMARSMEATDYDELEWNVCTRWRGDAGSVLTWGPYGKTLGWGGEILTVLKRVDRATVEQAFAAEGAQGLDRLLALELRQDSDPASRHAYPGARRLMEGLCKEPGQMDAWRRAFARLGALEEVRRAYEDVAFGDSAWFRYVVERLARSFREAGLTPSEIDLAFFIDRSIHMGWGTARFEAVDAALAAARESAGPAGFTNARARFAVAAAVAPKAHPEDRLARDAMFLIDAADELAPAMMAAEGWPENWRALWLERAGIAASDVGLSDARPAPGFDDAVRRAELG